MKRRTTDRITREKEFRHKWRATQCLLRQKNQDDLLSQGFLPNASYDPDRNNLEVRKARARQYRALVRKVQRERFKKEPNLQELSLKRLEEQVRLFSRNYDPDKLLTRHNRMKKRIVHRLHILEKWLEISEKAVLENPEDVFHKRRIIWAKRDIDLIKGEG